MKASAFVPARLGPGPNEGSAMVIARSFVTEPRMFCLVSPRVVFLETGYKLVELMQCPRVRAQQRSKIYGDVVHRITSGLIRAYKMERAREELEVTILIRNGHSYRRTDSRFESKPKLGYRLPARPTYTSMLFVIPYRKNNSVRERDQKHNNVGER